jgi:subtilisin family serine protease
MLKKIFSKWSLKKTIILVVLVLVLAVSGWFFFRKFLKAEADQLLSLDKPLVENNDEPAYVDDQIIIRFKEDATDTDIKTKVKNKIGKEPKNIKKLFKDNPELSSIVLAEFEQGDLPQNDLKNTKLDLKRAVKILNNDENILYAEPNRVVKALVAPNDPYYGTSGSWGQAFPDLWGIKKIQPETAWNTNTGGDQEIVAVIDTGVDYNHADLSSNILRDSQGKVVGYDFCNNDADPMDDHGHGTHVAGTIGAIGNNNLGVVGVNWKTKIMPIKFICASGSGTDTAAAQALVWSVDHGASVSSNSWGAPGYSQLIEDALKYNHGRDQVIVAAAGNDNANVLGFSPAGSAYTVAVSAFDYNDAKAAFSNYGLGIDVAAPGVSILSLKGAGSNPMCTSTRTVATNYCVVSGTSMATPHVAGLATLLRSQHPSLDNEQIRQAIRKGSDDVLTAGWDSSSGYGRINVSKSMVLGAPLKSKILEISFDPANQRLVTFNGVASGSNFASYQLSYTRGLTGTTWTNFATSTTPVNTSGFLGKLDFSSLANDDYVVKIAVKDSSGQIYEDKVFIAGFAFFKGLVKDIVTNQPIANMKVYILVYGGSAIYGIPTPTSSVITKSDGTFEATVSGGQYAFQTDPNSVTHISNMSNTFEIATNQTINVNFNLTSFADAGSITIKVTDSTTGTPVAGATTFAMYNEPDVNDLAGWSRRIYTATDGTVTYNNLQIGNFAIGVGKKGYYDNIQENILINPKQKTLHAVNLIPIGPVGSVAGRSVSNTGQGIPSTYVTAYKDGKGVATGVTDANGYYKIPNLPVGTYDVWAFLVGYPNQGNLGVVVKENLTTTSNYTFGTTTFYGSLTGKVLSTSGLPLAGATVTAGKSVITDANGNYTITGLAVGTYNVTVGMAGYYSQTHSVSIAKDQSTTENFSLSPVSTVSGNLTGTVTDSSGALMKGVKVVAKNTSTGFTKSATTSASGVYTVSGLPGGNYTVTASSKGLRASGQITVIANQSNTLNLVLAK